MSKKARKNRKISPPVFGLSHAHCHRDTSGSPHVVGGIKGATEFDTVLRDTGLDEGVLHDIRTVLGEGEVPGLSTGLAVS